tara:strand:- start:437 stop:568 length:132 start_codon:yes stop_codon:yes gene_type:complete
LVVTGEIPVAQTVPARRAVVQPTLAPKLIALVHVNLKGSLMGG